MNMHRGVESKALDPSSHTWWLAVPNAPRPTPNALSQEPQHVRLEPLDAAVAAGAAGAANQLVDAGEAVLGVGVGAAELGRAAAAFARLAEDLEEGAHPLRIVAGAGHHAHAEGVRFELVLTAEAHRHELADRRRDGGVGSRRAGILGIEGGDCRRAD